MKNFQTVKRKALDEIYRLKDADERSRILQPINSPLKVCAGHLGVSK